MHETTLFSDASARFVAVVSGGLLLAALFLGPASKFFEKEPDPHQNDMTYERTDGCIVSVSSGEWAGHPNHDAIIECPE